jgi:hypothetical protein
MAKRDILNSPRILEIKKRRKKIFLRKLGYFLGASLLGLIAFGFISRMDKININQFEISGNKIIDTEKIQAIIDQKLAGSYFKIFPRTNIFFYPKQDIIATLSSDLKRLKNINLSIRDNKILEVSVEERKALYVWCGLSPEAPVAGDTKSSCYFLDDSGFIFDQAPYFSGDIYFKFFGQISDIENPAGAYFAQENFLRLISLKEMLEDINIKPVALYQVGDGDAKIYLANESTLPMGPEIIFKMNTDFTKLVENLQSAMATDPLKTDFKKKYASLLYIDLRFGNKVYFKFK